MDQHRSALSSSAAAGRGRLEGNAADIITRLVGIAGPPRTVAWTKTQPVGIEHHQRGGKNPAHSTSSALWSSCRMGAQANREWWWIGGSNKRALYLAHRASHGYGDRRDVARHRRASTRLQRTLVHNHDQTVLRRTGTR